MSQGCPRSLKDADEPIRAALVVACVTCVVLSALFAGSGAAKERERTATPGRVYSWDFQADTLGHIPAHSMVFGGLWEVVEDSSATSAPAPASAASDSAAGLTAASATSASAAPRFLRQRESEDGLRYHYLGFTRPLLEDLDASVRFRIRAGELDPTAGILFQLDRKGTSGYLVRVSGKNNQVVFHYMLYGKRRDVKYAKIPAIEPGSWHTLSISRRKSVLRASYDGNEVMRARDDRFSRGTVGLWTEDDTKVDFADLRVTAR